jgi:hypothetical protein
MIAQIIHHKHCKPEAGSLLLVGIEAMARGGIIFSTSLSPRPLLKTSGSMQMLVIALYL